MLLSCRSRRTIVHSWLFLASALVILGEPSVAVSQDDEYQAGLVGRYGEGQREILVRIDEDIAFDWSDGRAAPELPHPFQTHWRGQLLVRSTAKHRFAAQLQGSLHIKINGQTVLQAEAEKPTWIEGEAVQIPPGLPELSINYSSTKQGGSLKLFWSAEDFSIEPIPTHHFFHEEDATPAQLVERGRQLFEAHRCHRCHADVINHELLPAPALWGITQGTSPEWIVSKLQGKNAEAAHAKMPEFGLTPQQADDIAQYLHRLGVPYDLVNAPEVPEKEREKRPSGKEMLYSLGCLGCHRVGDLGNNSPYAGVDLTNIGAKRSRDWLSTWLSSPDRINPQHRMPVFSMTRTERGILADELSKMGATPGQDYSVARREIPTDQVVRGGQLVKQLRCANCHKIPAVERQNVPASFTDNSAGDWSKSCLADQPDQESGRPFYPHADKAAIQAYLKSLTPNREETSTFVRGQHILQRNNCLGCHRRGTEAGLAASAAKIVQQVDSLKGQSQIVIPPSLNAVGDKLLDEVLENAVSGKQDRARANWLKVQMPRFHHADEDQTALTAYLIEHDRVPAEAATEHPSLPLTNDEVLLQGRTLIGAGGFSCIACHQVGDYVPRNVALGTRGSDLQKIGSRLRPEFYYRWTRAPLRVIPGMEMPSYQKPVPGVLGEDVHRQLAVVWKAVNDEKFEAPTNPTQVEQFWQVAEDSSPRVIRDVFKVAEDDGGGFIARSLALGLPNQHSLLLDLDTGSLRGWSFGDFARQQTEGKSWYWDLAGSPVMTGFQPASSFALQTPSGETITLNSTIQDRLARLLSYSTLEQTVTLHWKLDALIDDQAVELTLVDRIIPFRKEKRSGWQRTLAVAGLPQGYAFAVTHPADLKPRFQARIEATAGHAIHPDQEAPLVWIADKGQLTLEYTAELSPQPLAPIPEKVAMPPEAPVTTLPGFTGHRLRLPSSVMPTSMTWDAHGDLHFTSLKGHVFRALDQDADGLEDKLTLIDEGLAAPFGILADGKDLLVAHKPELLRLIDDDGDGRTDRREIMTDGWGYTDNYHDWTTGPIRGPDGNLFLALGSDYAQPKRERSLAQWRGKVLRLGSDESLHEYAHELRYPIGIAFDAQGRLFVSDQQGVQNTFNEVNLVLEGGRYGVPALLDDDMGESIPTTIKVPHPWTRSVNGIFFLPPDHDSPFAGHGIGCEYNSRFLIRFTVQMVDGVAQGGVYPWTRSEWKTDDSSFLGPMCGAVSPSGDVYIGSIHDSGWLGGQNTGEIVRLTRSGDIPNGIREVRATPTGFEIEFIHPVDSQEALDPENYSITAYTRNWQGSYATEDSDRHSPEIQSITRSDGGRKVILAIPNRREGFLYEFQLGNLGSEDDLWFPAFAAFTLNRIPKAN